MTGRRTRPTRHVYPYEYRRHHSRTLLLPGLLRKSKGMSSPINTVRCAVYSYNLAVCEIFIRRIAVCLILFSRIVIRARIFKRCQGSPSLCRASSHSGTQLYFRHIRKLTAEVPWDVTHHQSVGQSRLHARVAWTRPVQTTGPSARLIMAP